MNLVEFQQTQLFSYNEIKQAMSVLASRQPSREFQLVHGAGFVHFNSQENLSRYAYCERNQSIIFGIQRRAKLIVQMDSPGRRSYYPGDFESIDYSETLDKPIFRCMSDPGCPIMRILFESHQTFEGTENNLITQEIHMNEQELQEIETRLGNDNPVVAQLIAEIRRLQGLLSEKPLQKNIEGCPIILRQDEDDGGWLLDCDGQCCGYSAYSAARDDFDSITTLEDVVKVYGWTIGVNGFFEQYRGRS